MRWITTLTAVALIVAAAACGGSPTSPSGTGTFNLRLKDAPLPETMALLVTFSDVTAHVDGVGGSNKVAFANTTTTTDVTRTCDLLKLQNATDVLGVGQLPAGHYTMVRLVVKEAKLYDHQSPDGFTCVTGDVTTPPEGTPVNVQISGGEVKLNREFTVPEGGVTNMLIDFDAEKSVHQTGNGQWMMSPVISVLEVSNPAS